VSCIAAVGDLHVGADSRGLVSPRLSEVSELADVLLVAGDLTRIGTPDEIDVFIDELRAVTIPKVAVLGNHDHHAGRADELAARCEAGGITVLDGNAVVIEHDGGTLGIAGVKGFGGGFPGRSLSAFGEQIMKDFVAEAERDVAALAAALRSLDERPGGRPDRVVVLLHYAPIRATLEGEPTEIYPFLGSGRLAEVIDDAGADLVIHGHAHHGTECGATPGGIPVRNVAQPVIDDCYRLYRLGPADGALQKGSDPCCNAQTMREGPSAQ
jgi:Icc-related predicted phosphoesterase